MDWLTFKFCVLIWVLRVSKSQSQLLNSTNSLSNQLYSACEDGQPIVPPDQCNTCICFSGQIYCTNIPCPEQDCVNGVDLPQPDACNKCTCQEGKVTCSNMVCIPAPYCSEKQLYPAQNKCNTCMCLNGFITCTNNPCAEEPLSSTMPATTTKKPKIDEKCIEGDSLPGPNECVQCFCKNGRKQCKNICKPTVEGRFSQEPECVPGQHIPRPDDCNNCICFEGQIHCTHLPCQVYTRVGPECTDNQLVYRLDECNECYCFEGRLECSDLVCIRGSKCVHGQVIPKPDSCNACKCVEGHILCTDYQCPIPNSKNALRPGKSSTELWTVDECQEGEVIPPPPPPNDCNTCYCMDNRILCTMNSCEGSDPEIKERLRKPSEQTDLKKFDKQISVEPFINMLSQNYEKLPTKLIHTHAYNGFHQEIKVHASHLPKDATKLLKVLATSLDNSALASISQRLLTSSNSLSNNHDSKIPLDNQVIPTKLLGEGNVLTTQSSKLITSGSLSNETILVIPNTENIDDQNSQSVLPLIEHETIWKTVSSPDNNVQIDSRSSQEEKLNVYYYDNPPSMFAPIDQNNVIRNPSKFSRPGLQHMLPTKPTRNTVEKPNTNTQPIYPASNPNLININDGKISYAPFSQDNKQFKPIPSGFVPKRDELPHLRPYQLTKPGHKQVYNYTSSTPTFRPGKFIVTPNNNGGQQNPSQSQFIPNLSNYYPNHVKPQQIPFKPNQNHLPTLNNKGIQHPPLFPNNPNQPIVAANQYKQPQFGLKPGQGSVTHLNNKGNQTDQQFKAFPPNFQINPLLINLPNQKKRISSIANEGSKEKSPHSMVPNSTAHLTNILNPPQIGVDPKHTQHKSSHSQFVPNPSRYKIIEVNPDQEQLIPHSKISDTYAEHYNPPHTSFEPGHDIIIPKVSNKTRKYNTTHSHYEKHTSITYVSEYDPTHPANPLQIMHDPNQHQNAPQANVYEHFLPDQESQELDLIMSKVNYYLNIPNLQLDQNNSKKGGFSNPESAEGPQSSSYSAEDPTHLKSNEHLPPPSQTGPIQSQHPPGMFDDRGSINGLQYAHKAYEDPRQLKPVYKLPHLELETPQNHQLPGFFDEHGSADGFQYPSNSAEDLTHPKVKSPHFDTYTSIVNPEPPKDNLYISPHSQFVGPTQNQHKPGIFDNRGVKDEFQYAHNADKNPTHLKPLHKLLPFTHSHTPFGPTIIQHSPGMFDEHASADGFQYPSSSAENSIHSRGNLHNPKLIQFGPDQNQHLPEVFGNRGSAGGLQYPSNSVENTRHPKDKMHKLPQSQFLPSPNQHTPGLFDNRGSADGFQYPSNSAENPKHPKQNKQIQPKSPFGPAQNQHLPGIFDERGSADGFQYSSNSVENPRHPKDNMHKLPQSQFLSSPNQHTPGLFDDRGSADGFQYPSNSAENPKQPKQNKQIQPKTPFGSVQNQHLPGIFDERGSADGFQYLSNSVENPRHPEDKLHKLPQSQFLPSPNQHTSGVFGDRGSADGFQYSSNSAENLKHPKQNKQIQPKSPVGHAQNQHLPGIFDERGSADGLQYPSNSVEGPGHPKDNKHKLPQSQFLPSPNQHISGVFDDRGSADGFQYPSNSAENPKNPKQNKQIQPKSPFGPAQNQHLPGIFDERGSADGFQYPSNSVENPRHPKDNMHKLPQSQFLSSPNQHTPGLFDDRGSADGFQYPSNSAENPKNPKQNKQIQPKSPFGAAQNQHLPGIFDERGSADGFQYPSNSVENPRHPKDNMHKLPQSQFLPSPNQHTAGLFDDRGSADGFQYPSNSAENPKNSKQNKQIQPKSPFGAAQNQHLPGIFDERGSADGFQYPSNSVENPRHPKDNMHKLPQSQFLPFPNQHTPELFDDRGSADGFQYPSNSAENPKNPKQSKQIQPKSPFGPAQNQHLSEIFDERGSADGFQYPSNSVENPRHPKDNMHKLPQSQFLPSPNQHTPGLFDDRGSADGFQYPSNSAENPKQPKQNKQIESKTPFGSVQNKHLSEIFDERGSADGFQYPSNSVENPRHPKDNMHKLPQSQFLPSPNQHTPGLFDDRGSADGFQYPSNSAENPKQPKQNKQIEPKTPFGSVQNQHLPGIFDERGSADGFQYTSNSVENPRHPKDNMHKLPQSQFLPSPNQHTPGVFDDRGSADGFQYHSNSAENTKDPKQNKQIQPKSPFGPAQNQLLPGIFDERGSADGYQYPSNSVENPTYPEDKLHKLPQSQFLPSPNQHTPGVFGDRGSADGFHYPSNSAENPTHPTNNPNTIPVSKFNQPQNQPKPSSLNDGYNNNNPLRPWMHLDHDQYKPSSFDNLLNGVHNIPWSFSGDHNKDSDIVTSTPEPRFSPDYDQYAPSSLDHLFNGIHQIPWSVPNQDNIANFGSDAEITTPRFGFMPKQDQYRPSMGNNPAIYNQNENTDLTDVDNNQLQMEQDVSTPSTDLTDSDSTQYNLLPELKSDSDPDSLLPTDDGKIPDYYDQLYPLFKAVKKLSDPPIDDSVHNMGSMDQLDLLPFLFPGIAKILNYEPSQDQDDVSPVEHHQGQRINTLSKLNKSKLKQLPENDIGILNWLKSKLNKLVPKKYNATDIENDIDMTKIFNLLSKLTPHKPKHTTELQNIPFSGFDPEIIANIMNDFKEGTLTTTSAPRTDSTHSYENRFRSVPTIPEESRPHAPPLKYPEIHIILHQPNDVDNVDLPPYIETDDEPNLAAYMDSEDLSTSMFPKMFNPRFRHRPKDQEEECGDGTQWISNCHGCSCYFGQAMCFRLPDCKLRPLGEPMTCKPYSHFNMGCYTCECNGDGVAECDATDCNTKPSRKSRVSGSNESPLPIFNDFFDRKKTNEIMQYYNFYKKLPKDCPKQDLQTQYPTCERGTSWVSSCQKCECNESGKHECIKIDDCELDVDSYGKPGRCKPNSKFYPKTNSMPCVECSCNDEGIPYCPAADYKKQ